MTTPRTPPEGPSPAAARKWERDTCVCGHGWPEHDGHTVRVGDPPDTHCSQGCGCRAYKPAALAAPPVPTAAPPRRIRQGDGVSMTNNAVTFQVNGTKHTIAFSTRADAEKVFHLLLNLKPPDAPTPDARTVAEQIVAIQERLERITPGAWKAEDIGAGTTACGVVSDTGRVVVEHDFVEPADAEFIAHAPGDIRFLLAALTVADAAGYARGQAEATEAVRREEREACAKLLKVHMSIYGYLVGPLLVGFGWPHAVASAAEAIRARSTSEEETGA
jgi:hypothetical protein